MFIESVHIFCWDNFHLERLLWLKSPAFGLRIEWGLVTFRVLHLCTVTAELGSYFIEHITYTHENHGHVYSFSPTATALEVSANKLSYFEMGTGEPTATAQILLLLLWQSVPEKLDKAQSLFSWKLPTTLCFTEQRAAIPRSTWKIPSF